MYLSSRSQAASPLSPAEARDALAHFRVTTSHPGASGTASALTGHDNRYNVLASGRATGARYAHLVSPPSRRGLTGAPGARRYATGSASNNTNSAALSEYSGSGVPRRSASITENQVVQSPSPNPESARLESMNPHQSYPDPPVSVEESPGDVVATAPGPLRRRHQETTPDNMVGDDPRNPLKNHRNTVFYNVYPSGRRVVTARTRRPPPGTGYGTRYFHNGELCVGKTRRTISLQNDRLNLQLFISLCV